MDIKDIMSLVNAGFTKADIAAMTTGSAAPVQPEPKITSPEPTAEPPKADSQPQVVPESQPTVPAGVTLTQTQFDALMQSVRAGNSGIAVPPAYNLDAVLGDHFTNLLTGKEN